MRPEIGVADWTFEGSDEVAFMHARAVGLKQLQVDFGSKVEEAASRAAHLSCLAASTGIEITAVGARLFNQITLPQDADACPRVIDAVLEFASRLSVRQVFFPTFHAIRRTYDIVRIAEALSRACERAATMDLSVAVESTQGASEMTQLLNLIRGNSLRVVPDTYNLQTAGQSFDELIQTHSSVLTPYLHVKDGVAGRMGVARLGCGDGHVAERLSTALKVFNPASIIVESRFSATHAYEELRQDVRFILQQFAEMEERCPVEP